MEAKKELEKLVKRYQKAVHTQEREDFYPLWSKKHTCRLISVGTLFEGLDNIYEKFLAGGIRAAYETIDLVADSLTIDLVNENQATIVFAYHTECIRRGTGKAFGIQGLETQIAVREDGEWKLLHVHYSMVPAANS